MTSPTVREATQGSREAASVLRVRGLEKTFDLKSSILRRTVGHVYALRSVDVEVLAGQTVALVGESGSGKTTLARCVLGLEHPEAGQIELGPVDNPVPRSDRKAAARYAQVVFQDPVTSLSPRMSVHDIVAEPLVVHGEPKGPDRDRRVAEALDAVRIPRAWGSRLPHELSGGERQRIAIARALILRPSLIILDEPVSALDVSIQAQILTLLRDLQREYGVSYLLISHDLGVVRMLAHDLYVMYRGRIVERGHPSVLLETPRHPYTQDLLEADPSYPDWNLDRFGQGSSRPPAGSNPKGCWYAARCGNTTDDCRVVDPLLRPEEGVEFACLNPIGPVARHGERGRATVMSPVVTIEPHD